MNFRSFEPFKWIYIIKLDLLRNYYLFLQRKWTSLTSSKGRGGAGKRAPPVSGTRAPVHRGPGPPRRSTAGPREPTARIGPKPIGRPRGGAAGARARHETGSAEPWCWAACGLRRQQPAAPNGGEQPEDGGAHGQWRCTRKGRGAGGGAHRACGPTRQSGRSPAAGRGGGAPRGGNGDGGSAAFREEEPAADGRRDLGKEMKRLGEGRELRCGGKRRPK
uniref:Methyl-CpG binding protein-like n=2 Tax=Oryza sativa subsp. japonica TaxID=39947 RepID=Q69VP3_ORYSJ|nr:methyl-CpG binding protein-like [Oryza sativa Japonica Group]BAD31541.1 methyl-CpG binding protein-like [Oryza sativa Japonica Group]